MERLSRQSVKIHSNENDITALAHFKDGHYLTQIAKFIKVSRTNVNKWVHTFLEEGLEGLQAQDDFKKFNSKQSLRSQDIGL